MNPQYSRYYTFIRPIAKNRYVKTYSSLVFSLMAILVFSLFAIRPTISTILVLQKTIQQQNQVLASLTQKSQNLSLGKENLSKIDQGTKDKLNALLPNKTDITTLADSLSSLATQNQASISGFQLQPLDLVGESVKLNKDASLKEIDFTFNIVGDYTKLTSVLNSLSSSKRLIQVSTVNFNKSSTDNSVLMSVNAKAYFLQD